MPQSKLAQYLFKQLKDCGVEHTFGIPGDFILPLYAAQNASGMKTAVMTHEPGVGYAADAYARIRGLGVALVTYGAGGLNMVNPVGLAYAEESPLLVISGAPETRFMSQPALLHHCVKSFDTQYKVYEEVTETQASLSNPATAQTDIDRVINSTQRLSKPGYLEIPRDMVNHEIEVTHCVPQSIDRITPAIEEAAAEIVARLHAAKSPVIFAGSQIRRFRALDKVLLLSEKLSIPVVTSVLGKSSFPESHPNFIGNYVGQFGDPNVRQYVESSDCILALGTVLTEMETGGYTAKLDTKNLIQINARESVIGHHVYPGSDLPTMLQCVLQLCSSHLKSIKTFSIPNISHEQISEKPGTKFLTVAGMIEDLSMVLNSEYSVVCDVGDCLYAGLSLKSDSFICPGYYSSMGFGVPAGIGAQLADPSRRPIILVGDGAFQMTGMEISTAVKLGLNPIVVVFNNSSYAMLKFIDQSRDYYKLQCWDYAGLAHNVGAKGARATTRADFKAALRQASSSKELFLIDAVISEDDISPTLKRLTDHFGKKVKAALDSAHPIKAG